MKLLVALLVIFCQRNYLVDGNLENRIYGGKLTEPGQFPFVVSIQYYNGRHVCTGSIIDEYHVLTAAYCTLQSARSVSIGWSLLFPLQRHRISTIMTHPNWTSTNENDIAIVVLETPIWFADTAQPVQLQTHPVFDRTSAMVVGYGLIENQASPAKPRYLEVELIGRKRCEEETKREIGESQICAYAEDMGGVCEGDVGGALVANGKLIGVVSWSAGGTTGVYANVSAFVEWIRETTLNK